MGTACCSQTSLELSGILNGHGSGKIIFVDWMYPDASQRASSDDLSQPPQSITRRENRTLSSGDGMIKRYFRYKGLKSLA